MAQKYSLILISFLLIISFFIFSLPIKTVFADGEGGTETGTELDNQTNNEGSEGDGQASNNEPTGNEEQNPSGGETGGEQGGESQNVEQVTLNYWFDTTLISKDINGNDLPLSYARENLSSLALPLPDIDYTKYDIESTTWLVKVGTRYSDMTKNATEENVTFSLPAGFTLTTDTIDFKVQTEEKEYEITFEGLPSYGVAGISIFPETMKYKKGDTIDFSSQEMTPSFTGYVFMGWFDDADFTQPATNITEESYGDKTVWASIRLNRITIKFSGAEYDSQQVDYGTIAFYVIKDKNPTREGYEFGGWFTDKYCTQQVADTTLILGSDGAVYTFYAKWNQKAQPWIYFVILSFVCLTVFTTMLWWFVFKPKKESIDA